MSLIRPEITAWLFRWREVLVAAGVAAAGLWTASRGGWILGPFGLALAALACGWAILAARRLRFRSDPGAAGLVELDEGRLRYLHPTAGGEISLVDLAELRLLRLKGRPVWAMRDLAGGRLLVPLEAAGAEALFDAFAALPGLSSADLVAALDPGPARAAGSLPALSLENRPVWTRRGSGLRRI
ncbi:MAG: hypothetical protein IAE87_17910 [Rhodobacteraceae bacterium]|jgi:hypothetical protein|nr:hypothetical protein [Paracoccaceae bacterium]